ncbi:pH-response regulator protein palH/rim21 [Orbilia brochopaga]|uniref:PH-response regulator protein palH/rim21 n=1 Tax=Orbilia brochopaga TaxID=3140254 RepID=A0AAV9U3M6_9PEZI
MVPQVAVASTTSSYGLPAVPSTTLSTARASTATPFIAAAIWRETSSKSGSMDPSCTPYILPSLGLVKISPNSTITLQAQATFTPGCLINDTISYLDSNDNLGGYVPQSDLRDPFYASSIPMAYAIGGTTVIAYILMIILLISPPGSRPLLQKVATLTVVISLTIAWSELNDIIEYQYGHGYSNGGKIRDHILKGLTVQITRVISDTFLYLAQVQTLIRLFPRHREKLVIKWAGLVLIVLDTIFNIINNFFAKQGSPKRFLDAIPALSYLLQIALSLLYACCVLYYMFSHRQFSVMMPWSINNQHKHASDTSKVAMPLIALVTTGTIFVPLVFFVLDISNGDLAGWGDFVRWIGACAASVIVWEMADRIEYYEKLTIHAGILGRQVFEGDEMLQGIGGRVVDWGDGRGGRGNGPGGGGGGGAGGALGRRLTSDEKVDYNGKGRREGHHGFLTRPTPPLSMAASGSTTYVIRVHQSQTPPNQARPSSIVSRSTSSARETNHGTSTISDLVISPTNTPSNDTGGSGSGPRRNITFSDNVNGNTADPTDGGGQSRTLAYTYRPGQAPFSPEDFGGKKSRSTGPLGLGRLFKFFQRGEAKPSTAQSRDIPPDEIKPPARQEAALGQQVSGSFSDSQTPSNQTSAQSSIPENDAFGHPSVSPDPNLHPPQSPLAAVSPPHPSNDPDSDSDEPRASPSSVLKNLWKRKPSLRGPRVPEPYPITYVPAQARGNNPVNPSDVEEARSRELERIRGGESATSSDVTSSSPSNTSDAIITRFEQHPTTKNRATPGTESLSLHRSSVSPASRLRHSVDFDLDNAAPPVSPRRQQHLHTHSAGGSSSAAAQSITPPPPVTRSSTASPSGSVRTSSTGSWQYRASPNNGGVRLAPVNPRPYNPNEGSSHAIQTSGPHLHTHQHQHQHQPEGIGPNLPPPMQSKSSVPTKPLGRPLDPTVIPEEAEVSSMASASVSVGEHAHASTSVDHGNDPSTAESSSQDKGKARAVDQSQL